MTTGATPRVSLVIPVYDAGPYLRPCLESVAAQDLASLEVIAVDDGSNDGSGALLDEFARERGWRVIHQENSGWPGRPRNVGLDAASGVYVFFLDADDELGPEALRRLAGFADDHSADLVVPKMVGLGGRQVVEEVYAQTLPDVDDRALLFGTLTPGKLFRRSFLVEQGLRFPEGRVRLEDGQMVARAYLSATRVSIYADYDCYFLRRREDGGNISYDLGAPDQYTGGIAGVLDVVRAHADEALADAVALDLYQRKALKQLRPSRYFNYDEARRREWVSAIGDLARAHVPPHVEDRLSRRFRLRARLARAGDLTGLEAVLRVQEEDRDLPVVVTGGRVLLDLPHDGEPLDLTADVRLYAGVTSLRVRRDHVDIQGEVRLRGARAERIPLRLNGGRPPQRLDQKLVAEVIEGSSWCWFDVRVELGEWLESGRGLALRLKVRNGPDMLARLAVIVPPREDEPAGTLQRARRNPTLIRLRRAGKSR